MRAPPRQELPDGPSESVSGADSVVSEDSSYTAEEVEDIFSQESREYEDAPLHELHRLLRYELASARWLRQEEEAAGRRVNPVVRLKVRISALLVEQIQKRSC